MAAAITSLSTYGGQSGDSVTITGTGFGAVQGGGGVTFGGVAATIDSWSATSIACTIAGSPTSGNQTLEVTANDMTTDDEIFWIFERSGPDDTAWGTYGGIYQKPGVSGDSAPEDRTYADSRDLNRALEGVDLIRRSPFIRQVVEATEDAEVSTAGTIPFDNTIPQISEGGEMLTVSITPKNASSRILVVGKFVCSIGTVGGENGTLALYKDAVADALDASAVRVDTAGGAETIMLWYMETAGSTAARTFRVRGGSHTGGNSFYINSAGGNPRYSTVESSHLMAIEIGPEDL